MKKALIHAHTAYHLTQFNMDNIRILQEMGYEVDVAACWNDDDSALSPEAMATRRQQLIDMGCNIIETASLRKIFAPLEMLKAYATLKNACRKNQYRIVHTQSPIGGVICRLACRFARRRYGTKVIYMAHGFHFFEGAPLKNWLIYYQAERFCARFTDLIITINQEDYECAMERFGKFTKVKHVNGVGIDTEKYAPSEGAREKIRAELGLKENDIALLSIGELILRKNHGTVIRAIAELNNKNIHYYIAGRGRMEEPLRDLVLTLELEDQVTFLGFRTDIADVIAGSDIFVFPSFQEGLPAALMEVMAVGKPAVISEIRGNVDLIEDGQGGFLCDPKSAESFAEGINKMIDLEPAFRDWMGRVNREKMRKFDKVTVNEQMKKVYEQII